MMFIFLVSASALFTLSNAFLLSETERSPLAISCEEYLLAPSVPFGPPRKVRVCVPAAPTHKATPNTLWDTLSLRAPVHPFRPIYTDEARMQPVDTAWRQSRIAEPPSNEPFYKSRLLNRHTQIAPLPYPVQAARIMENRESNDVEPVNNEIGWQLPAQVDAALVRRINAIGDDVSTIKATLSDLTSFVKSYASSLKENSLPARANERNEERELNIHLRIDNTADERINLMRELFSDESAQATDDSQAAAELGAEVLSTFLQGFLNSIVAGQELPTRVENTAEEEEEEFKGDPAVTAEVDIDEQLNALFAPTFTKETSNESTSNSSEESFDNSDADNSHDNSAENDAEWQAFLRRFIMSKATEVNSESDTTAETFNVDTTDATAAENNENAGSGSTSGEIIDDTEMFEMQESSETANEATTNEISDDDSTSNSNEKSSEEEWDNIFDQFLLTTESPSDYTDRWSDGSVSDSNDETFNTKPKEYDSDEELRSFVEHYFASSTPVAATQEVQNSQKVIENHSNENDYDEYDFVKRFYESTTTESPTKHVSDLINYSEVSAEKSSEENDESTSKDNDYNEYLDTFMQRYFERVTTEDPIQSEDERSDVEEVSGQSGEIKREAEEFDNLDNQKDSNENSNENSEITSSVVSKEDNSEDNSEEKSMDGSTKKSVNCDISQYMNGRENSAFMQMLLTRMMCPDEYKTESMEKLLNDTDKQTLDSFEAIKDHDWSYYDPDE